MRISDWSSDVCSSDRTIEAGGTAAAIFLPRNQFYARIVEAADDVAGCVARRIVDHDDLMDRIGLGEHRFQGFADDRRPVIGRDDDRYPEDRKSTRLNSSH